MIEVYSSRYPNKREILAEGIHNAFSVFRKRGVDALLVGSLGRFASIDIDPPKVDSSMYDRGIKDIDVMILGPKTEIEAVVKEANKQAYPCKVDQHFAGVISSINGGSYIQYNEIGPLQVSSSVFQRLEKKVLGEQVQTLDPQTLFHLTLLQGLIRRKDFYNLIHFARLIRARQSSLPEELFRPFHDIYQEQERRHSKDKRIRAIRWTYQRFIPENARYIVRPVAKPARILLEKALQEF